MKALPLRAQIRLSKIISDCSEQEKHILHKHILKDLNLLEPLPLTEIIAQLEDLSFSLECEIDNLKDHRRTLNKKIDELKETVEN